MSKLADGWFSVFHVIQRALNWLCNGIFQCMRVLQSQGKVIAGSVWLGIFFLVRSLEITASLLGEIALALDQVVSLMSGDQSGTVFQNTYVSMATYVGMANSLMPIEESIQFLLAYMVLMGSLITYRFLKSWVPTLSG